MFSTLLILTISTALLHARGTRVPNSDAKDVRNEDSNTWNDVETSIQDRARSAHPPSGKPRGRIYIETGGSEYLSPGYGEIPSGSFSGRNPGFYPQYPPYFNVGPALGYRPPTYTYPDRFNYFYRNKDGQGYKEDEYKSF